MIRRCVALVFCLGLSVTGSLHAAEGPEKVATVEGVTEYKYPNGARVLLFPDGSQPTITVNMTVLVGSRHEGIRRSGDGSPAGASGVQGNADVSGSPEGFA